MNTTARPRSIASFAAALALSAIFSNSATAQVDLVADQIVGPGQVHVGATNLVTIRVKNTGDPLVRNYTAEIVLSQDLTVDASDPVIATLDSDLIGQQSPLVTIPWNIPDVPHVWGLRLLPAAGEKKLANNTTIGGSVKVFSTDLQLDDPTPVQVFVRIGETEPPAVQVRVNNMGTVGSIVVFTIAAVNPAPWLIIEEPSSFAVGGQKGNDVEFRFDHSQLTAGNYTTLVRFQNITNPADYQDLDLTLTVGEPYFTPGHFIVGQISHSGEVDKLAFHAVKGMRLKLRVKTPNGNLKPKISIVDPFGVVEEKIGWKHTKNDRITKVVKLKSSGEYTLTVTGAKGSKGGYTFFTKRKLPKKAKPRTVKLKNPGLGKTASTKVLLLPGAKLEFCVKPNAAYAGPMAVGFDTPSSKDFDISSYSTLGPKGELIAEDLELDECGAYLIMVGNFGSSQKAKAKVNIIPFQPKRGKGKIYLK